MIAEFRTKSLEIEDERLREIEQALDYSFRDKQLLVQALMHSSRANEFTGDALDSNERLEFLGDAVLEEIVSIYLYRKMPDKLEGVLSKTRAQIVCEESLASVARDTGLNTALMLGKGEEKSGGSERNSIIADAVEAVIGAIYLDGGQEAARAFIFRVLGKHIDMAVGGLLEGDPKTQLQELLQARGITSIAYRIVDEEGPAHDKIFTAALLVNGSEQSRGTGRSKQLAEAAAASEALRSLK